jgi:hypothetical protein
VRESQMPAIQTPAAAATKTTTSSGSELGIG